MNLLVHMDARGTSSVYPHLGIRATYFVGEMERVRQPHHSSYVDDHVTSANPGKSHAGKPASARISFQSS